jgi:phenylpropionate dioxygenase-like ring-hydroxylating dioxygenase large terminal subunit
LPFPAAHILLHLTTSPPAKAIGNNVPGRTGILARDAVTPSREPAPGGPHAQCWYPVALSEEVRERPLGVDFLGARVAVYRRASGAPVVLGARCPHMGADLSQGEVVGDELRCMFHHFRYGPDGRCAGVPSGEPPPRAARVASYPTAECWGLVWAFNGPQPLFAPPALRGWKESRSRCARAAPTCSRWSPG